ncbi:MAG: hypothetical protein JWM68_5221 [Verrucomicrobiales bacterium]|nr:hypothetical protein [Verrucomicrobiales bacterium]
MTRALQLLGLSFFFWQQLFSAIAQEVGSSTNTVFSGKAVLRVSKGSSLECAIDGTTWKPFKVGNVANEGTTIRTGPDSSAYLFLGRNGPVLWLGGNTVLRFEILSSWNSNGNRIIKTVLDLKAGQIGGQSRAPNVSDEFIYQVKTSGGVAEVQEADYMACQNGKTGVMRGSVNMVCASKSFSIDPKQIFNPMIQQVQIWSALKDSVWRNKTSISPGHQRYQIAESFRRIHDGWPPQLFRPEPLCSHEREFRPVADFKCEN